MSDTEREARKRLIQLVRSRTLIPIKRHDVFLTALRVAMLRSNFKVVCVEWDW